jgi:hypothetical protein
MSGTIASDEINYVFNQIEKPSYAYARITPLQGQTFTAITSETECIFEIPAITFNPSKCYLSATLAVPAPTAATDGVVLHMNDPMMSQLQVYTRGGTYLMNLSSSADYYANMQSNFSKFEDIKHADVSSRQCMSNAVRNTAATASDAWISGRAPILSATTAQQPASLDFLEEQYFDSSINAAETLPTSVAISKRVIIDLGAMFKETFWSIDKSLLVNEVLIVRMVFKSPANIGFQSVLAGTMLTLSPTQPQIPNYTLSSVLLYVCQDKNQTIQNSLASAINSPEGFKMQIPYGNINKNNIPASTVQNTSTRFSSFNGKALRKIKYALYNSDESSKTRYDRSNLTVANLSAVQPIVTGAKVVSYQTMLNNVRLEQFDYNCLAYDDYEFNKQFFADTVIQNRNIYQYKWVHVYDWTNMELEKDSNLYVGLDLTNELRVDFTATTANVALNHYILSETSKLLMISSQGLSVI